MVWGVARMKVISGEHLLVYGDELLNQAMACHGVRPAISRSDVPSCAQVAMANEVGVSSRHSLMKAVSFWIWGSAEQFVIVSRNTHYSGSSHS